MDHDLTLPTVSCRQYKVDAVAVKKIEKVVVCTSLLFQNLFIVLAEEHTFCVLSLPFGFCFSMASIGTRASFGIEYDVSMTLPMVYIC